VPEGTAVSAGVGVADASCCPGPAPVAGGGAPPPATGAERITGDGPTFVQVSMYSRSAATEMNATPAKVARTLPPPLLRTERSRHLAPRFGPRHDDRLDLVLGLVLLISAWTARVLRLNCLRSLSARGDHDPTRPAIT